MDKNCSVKLNVAHKEQRDITDCIKKQHIKNRNNTGCVNKWHKKNLKTIVSVLKGTH